MATDTAHLGGCGIVQRAIEIATSTLPNHELAAAFAVAGLPLHRTLVEMLDEHHSHQTERRGCGFTQATRFLADLVNRPQAPESAITGLFDEARQNVQNPGQQTTRQLQERLALGRDQVASRLKFPESKLLLGIMEDLSDPQRVARAERSAFVVAAEKLKVGSCPLAEQYFLEIAHGRVRRGGRVNVLVDANGEACLLEKRGLGDEHSCISVRSLEFGGVRIPRGSLFAIDYAEERLSELPRLNGINGHRLEFSMLDGARFLRLTTLAVAPADRARAFSTHFKQQIDGGLFSPDSTTIDQLAELAQSSLL
jgi:hypothetical protein